MVRTLSIRILIADDHALVRSGIRALLDSEPDMAVVGEAADGEEAVEQAKASVPDVVLMDIRMPGGGGLVACRDIADSVPGVRVLILTMHEDTDYLKEALRAGASGYILKESGEDDLKRAIRAVVDGTMTMSPAMVRAMADNMVSGEEAQDPKEDESFKELTPREREVFTLIARGYSNLEIASALFISVKTVETHKANLKQKLGTSRRSELVRYALRLGILDDPDQPTTV